MECRICGVPTEPAFRARIMGKYDAGYHRCPSCGFMQTDDPFWLSESYASAINDIDLGPVNRAVTGSRLVEGVILSFFDPAARHVDYGAGYGVLVRLMRDRGFDFYWSDPHCQNIFAKHFVAEPGRRFELLTAFEVFEHLADPIQEIGQMLEMADNLLFSTLLVPRRANRAEDWWYFGPEHGQHIAFYTRRALEVQGERFGLHLASDGEGMHLLSRRKVPERAFRLLARDGWAARGARMVLRRRLRQQSLLQEDFRAVSGHQL